MSRSCLRIQCVLSLLVSAFPLYAQSIQTLTPVAYVVRHDPNNPASAVDWTIQFSLKKVSVSGNQVGWRIKSLEVNRFGQDGQISDTWIKSLPAVSSSDGLWWVTHADPSDPQLAEFNAPPALTGSAAAQQIGGEALTFSISGAAYSPPEGDPPFGGNVSALSIDFAVASLPPLDQRTDEPAEISDGMLPPFGT